MRKTSCLIWDFYGSVYLGQSEDKEYDLKFTKSFEEKYNVLP